MIHPNPKDEFLIKNLGKLNNMQGTLGSRSVSSVNLGRSQMVAGPGIGGTITNNGNLRTINFSTK